MLEIALVCKIRNEMKSELRVDLGTHMSSKKGMDARGERRCLIDLPRFVADHVAVSTHFRRRHRPPPRRPPRRVTLAP